MLVLLQILWPSGLANKMKCAAAVVRTVVGRVRTLYVVFSPI